MKRKDLLKFLEKVLLSCETDEQATRWYCWAETVSKRSFQYQFGRWDQLDWLKGSITEWKEYRKR